MRICNINRRMRKWKQGIVIFLMFLLSIIFVVTASNAADQKASATDKTQQSVQVKLPEGLYLYQPKIIQMYKYSPTIKDDLFSPLFIVEKGRLIDPYPLAKKIGIQKFNEKYVTGKPFNVYVGTEMVGKLSNVNLKLYETSTCYYEPFSFDISGSGKYEGKPLPGRYVDKSVYAHNNSELFLNQTVKAVATPQSFNKSKIEAFTVTEEDKTRAVKEVRKNLIPEAMKTIEDSLRKENGVILKEMRSRLEFIKAVDIDGNGRKDIIGEYALYVSYAKKTELKNVGRGALNLIEILFILWDTGRIEKVLFGDVGVAPAFGLGGLIDIDQDWVQEVVVQIRVSLYEPEAEDDEGGKRIEILRRDSSGWKSIYRSMRVCDSIN